MMQSLFLTDEELIELTGFKQKHKQEEALNTMGIPHARRPDRSLAVVRDYVLEKLGMKKTERKKEQDAPNFEPLINA
jgi:hypothetical protein